MLPVVGFIRLFRRTMKSPATRFVEVKVVLILLQDSLIGEFNLGL